MTVTEFATVPLTYHLTKENPVLPTALIQKWKTARTVLEHASHHKFYYYQQVEDPSIIYIIGQWDSPAAHGIFLPSPENQQLLELLKDDIVLKAGEDGKVMQMWHLNVDILNLQSSSGSEWVLSAPVVSCNRHFVAKEKKEGFEKKFQEVKGLLEEFTKPYGVVGGWRVEKEADEKEEWVLFSGFQSVENHFAFAKTEAFEKYRELVGFVEGFDIKHFQRIEGL